uniref:Tc1-like transposase DDE domain-containing protein n=1 Tax=Cyprinus carpio carpio TaxID=630221 RepID=A0A9J8AFI0_CYPCA
MVSQSSSVGYTITGKTADLTVVQKTTIDTLHKEGKTQKVIAKEAGCSQSSVSKHINREAKGRKRCGRKKCTSNRDNRTLERIVKQNPFKNVGEILEHFMLPAADQLYGDADFIFQQDLAPAHSAKDTSTWFKDHSIPVLNWPANSPDLNPIENLWGIVKRKMQYARPKNAEELKATIRATWALITPEQCHRLIDSMPRRIAAVIQAKGAPAKY